MLSSILKLTRSKENLLHASWGLLTAIKILGTWYVIPNIPNTHSDAQYLIFANTIYRKWIWHKQFMCQKYTTVQLEENCLLCKFWLKVDCSRNWRPIQISPSSHEYFVLRWMGRPTNGPIDLYRARLKGGPRVWWILFLLLLTISGWLCLQHSRNLGSVL